MKVEHKTMKEMQKNGDFFLIDGLTAIPGISNISTGNSIGKPVIRGLSASSFGLHTRSSIRKSTIW